METVALLNAGELAMDTKAEALVGICSLFAGLEGAKINRLPLSIPALSKPSLVVGATNHSGKAGLGLGTYSIDRVLPTRRLSKIIKPIIRRISVDVVDLGERPAPMHIEPNEPMSEVDAVVDVDRTPTSPVEAPGDRPGQLTTGLLQTDEVSGLRIVTEHLSQDGLGDGGFRHIGFLAAMILNRLVNERQIKERDAGHEGPRDERNSDDKKERADLADIEGQKKRLALLSARVREEGST
jgi:hypothetical protein